MKQSIIKCFVSAVAIALLAGCASNRGGAEMAAAAASAKQIVPAPGMNKINVTVVLDDKRPVMQQIRYGSSNIERPEQYFNNTINLVGYTIDYLSKARLFKTVSTTKAPGNYTLKLVWKSAHLNLNGWIPFVIRFQNHMTIDMILMDPAGKTVWSYMLDGFVVNTPSSFRIFSSHRCDIFQEKVLEEHYPAALSDMCTKLNGKLK